MISQPSPAVDIPSAPEFVRLRDGTQVATWVIEPALGYRRLGDIVICHGTPWSSRMWLPLARDLGRSHRVFLWDMPGYGESIPASGSSPAEVAPPVDLISQRLRLAELLELWELESSHVIAHDIGGAVTLGAHLFEACAFTSLYLLDIVTLAPWGSPFFRLVAENEAVFAALPPQLHRALVAEYIAGASGHRLEEGWIDELASPWCTAAGQAAFYRQIASLRPEHTEPIVDRLGEVRCPVHIGWGTDDPWIPVGQAEQLALLLPGDPVITRFPRAGHLVPLESPAAIAEDIRAWAAH